MTNSQRQHGIGSLAPNEKIVGKPGGLVEPGVKQYGFFKKAFKKIKKGAKKVFKSPLGKAAMLGLGAYYMPGIGAKASGGWGPWASRIGGWGKGALLGKQTTTLPGQATQRAGGIFGGLKNMGWGKAALLGGGALATALPFMGGGDEEDEVIDDWSVTPSSIANIRKMARAQDPSLAFLPPASSVMSGYYGSKDGGIVGLANGGQPAEAQAEQMLKMEYQKYRNQGGTMSYQQFKMAVLQQAQGQGPMAQGQQAPMAQPQMAAHGGRIGYNRGRVVNPGGYAGDEYELPTFSEEVEQEFPSDERGAINTEGLDLELIASMFKDMTEKGADEDTILSTISTVSGADPSILIRLFNTFAQGGRAGYQGGELVEDASMVEATPAGMMEENVEEVQGEPTREQMEALAMEIFQLRLEELDEEQLMVVYQAAMEQQPKEEMMQEEIEFNPQMAQGQPQMAEPQMAAEGGIMNLGGMEKDYRAEGGFVPIGGKEKADDVPARLSKNEFVFTADAVRNAGGGNIDKGAEVMENMMNNLEEGGQISEDSQGAQGMYDNMKQLQTRTA